MKEHMAYPDELLYNEKVDEVYSALDPDEEDYVGNTLKNLKHLDQYNDLQLREVVDPEDWRDWQSAASVDANYMPWKNTIGFQAGILQGTVLAPQ